MALSVRDDGTGQVRSIENGKSAPHWSNPPLKNCNTQPSSSELRDLFAALQTFTRDSNNAIIAIFAGMSIQDFTVKRVRFSRKSI